MGVIYSCRAVAQHLVAPWICGEVDCEATRLRFERSRVGEQRRALETGSFRSEMEMDRRRRMRWRMVERTKNDTMTRMSERLRWDAQRPASHHSGLLMRITPSAVSGPGVQGLRVPTRAGTIPLGSAAHASIRDERLLPGHDGRGEGGMKNMLRCACLPAPTSSPVSRSPFGICVSCHLGVWLPVSLGPSYVAG